MIAELLCLAACVGAGLVAGLCFTFDAFVMRALDELGAADAIRAMQAINRRILRSPAMAVWFGTAGLAVLAVVASPERLLPGLAAGAYLLGALLITGRGNVPLNDRLEALDPGAEGAEQAWRDYRRRWGRWNRLRTVVLVLSAAGFALAA